MDFKNGENRLGVFMIEKILDLGCGSNKLKGSIGIDKNKECNPDIVHDLNKFPYPFKKNTFDVINARCILEHLLNTLDVLNELYRISKPNAIIKIIVPHFSSQGAWNTPSHVKAFGCLAWRSVEISNKFDCQKVELHYLCRFGKKNFLFNIIDKIMSFLANLNIWFCERIWCYWVGGFNEIYVELKVKKII